MSVCVCVCVGSGRGRRDEDLFTWQRARAGQDGPTHVGTNDSLEDDPVSLRSLSECLELV